MRVPWNNKVRKKITHLLLTFSARLIFVFVSVDKIRFFYIGIHFQLESIINKWKKLKQQYKQHHDKQKRSGTERRKKWKFFDDVDQICGHRDTSSPACLIDSGLADEGAGKVFLMSIWWGRAYMVYVNIRIMTSITLRLAVWVTPFQAFTFLCKLMYTF